MPSSHIPPWNVNVCCVDEQPALALAQQGALPWRVLMDCLSCAAVSGVAILMGLNLLGALPLRLPSLDVDIRSLSLPPLLQVRWLVGAPHQRGWMSPEALPGRHVSCAHI